MKDTTETCLICFTDYLAANTKDHQCPDTFCGACGEQYDPTTEQDENGFHLSEICGANDEEKEEMKEYKLKSITLAQLEKVKTILNKNKGE